MTVEIKIDMAGVIDLSDSIGKLPAEMSSHVVTAVNSIAQSAYETGKRMIVSQVNLSRDKVDSKMRIDLASESYPTAIITANGRGTLLSNFGAKQLTKPSARSKSGVKNAGVSVNIKPSGAPGVIERGFFMRLKTNGAIGVFARDQAGRVRIRYGPSVDQVFQGVAKDISPQVEIDLQNELLSELDKITVAI